MFNSTGNIFLFLLSGTSAVVGNSLLKAGVTQLKNHNLSLSNFAQILTVLASNWQIILGFTLYGISSVLYLKLLSSVDVTKVYPALVGYMAIVILLIGAIFLREPINLLKIAGAAVIVGGILILNQA